MNSLSASSFPLVSLVLEDHAPPSMKLCEEGEVEFVLAFQFFPFHGLGSEGIDLRCVKMTEVILCLPPDYKGGHR